MQLHFAVAKIKKRSFSTNQKMLLAWVFLSVSSRCNIDGFFGWLEGKSLEALKKLRRLKRCCCFFTLLLRSLGSTKLYKTSLRRLGCYTICKIEHLYYNKEVFFVSQKQTRMEAFLVQGFLKIEKRDKKKYKNSKLCYVHFMSVHLKREEMSGTEMENKTISIL